MVDLFSLTEYRHSHEGEYASIYHDCAAISCDFIPVESGRHLLAHPCASVRDLAAAGAVSSAAELGRAGISQVEAVERQAEREERLQNFVKEALSADADVERTGEMYRAEEVHAWLERLATGQKSPRPKPWRR